MIKQLRSLALVALTLGALAFTPPAAHAALNYTQGPTGKIAHNDGSQAAQKEQANAFYDYGWQWSGPFYASVVSYTATIITPRNLGQNTTLYYQGPVRVIGYCQQNIQWQATNLTSTPGLTWTASSNGFPVAASATVDTGTFGSLWGGASMAIMLTPTVSGTTNNFIYWTLDKNW